MRFFEKGTKVKTADMTMSKNISEARARIADLLLEIDDIILQVNPQIEAEYATKIGYLEKRFAEMANLRATRPAPLYARPGARQFRPEIRG